MYTYARTALGRLWWDTLRLKIRVLRDTLRKAETACRIAGSLESVSLEWSATEALRDRCGAPASFHRSRPICRVWTKKRAAWMPCSRMADIYEANTRAANAGLRPCLNRWSS
jgi:hypothetical protein